MSADKCRWFNKNGFALGTGECVLHRRVCGSGHKVCEQYEEYESRPHGEWIEHRRYNPIGCFYSAYECSNCRDELWQMTEWQFCPNCGSDNRKRGETE